jgi:hypothetical protein
MTHSFMDTKLRGDHDRDMTQKSMVDDFWNILYLACDNIQCDDGYDCVTINPICASLRVPCDTAPKVLCLPRNGTNLPALPLSK